MSTSIVTWPTRSDFLRVGFEECRGKSCRRLIDPENLPSGWCLRCRRKPKKGSR